ncbi:MAG: hypothetical protein ABH950_00055 [Candidatus Altiarchaeota archaeon]
MDKYFTLLNVFLYFIMVVECLAIINVLTTRNFRVHVLDGKISIMNLLGSWRLILLAIALGSLREAYLLLEQWLNFHIPNIYGLIGTGFLLALTLGLYSYLQAARQIRDYVETKKVVDELEA